MDFTSLLAVSSIFYSQGAPYSIPVEEIYALAAPFDAAVVDETLRALGAKGLVRLSLDGRIAYSTLAGKVANDEGSVAALVLGSRYISETFGPAVVHIIVDGPAGERGGTGFFSGDFENSIVTAAHVLHGRTMLRIEDSRGNLLSRGPFQIRAASEEIDIAVIQCLTPEGVKPLQIEWRPEEIRPLDQVLVLGYPPIANHQPALFHAVATIHAIPTDYRGRSKLVVSSITRPGCSGGPLISERGFVVGIIEQENNLVVEHQTYAFFTATLAQYITEFVQRQ
ncbi:MAG: serine protease [Terriglobales bacterium]|jgi:S1-C subfamily serine protease